LAQGSESLSRIFLPVAMQHLFVLALMGSAAAVVNPLGEAGRLSKEVDVDKQLLSETQASTASIEADKRAEEKKAVENEKSLTKLAAKDQILDQNLAEEEKGGDARSLKAAEDKANTELATLTKKHDGVAAELANATHVKEELKQEVDVSHKKVVAEERAFLASHAALTSADELVEPVKPSLIEKKEVPFTEVAKSMALLDPSPVTDKTVSGGGVPEQGFEGPAVAHRDMETITEDWGGEYGSEEPVKPAFHAVKANAAVLGFLALLAINA